MRASLRRIAAALVAGKARWGRGELAGSVAYCARRKRRHVELVSGFAIAIPVAHVECLAYAKPAAIRAVQITGNGSGLRWDALDADLSVPDLVAECFGTGVLMKSLASHAGRPLPKPSRPRREGTARRAGGRASHGGMGIAPFNLI